MSVPKLRFKEFDGDWTLASLNQLSSKIGDGIHATPKYDENGTIPFINGNNLVNGQIIINGNTKRINTEEFQKYNQILSDQTLFLSINGTIGNLAFYKNEQILLGKSVCFINLKNDIDKKFIYLLLQSPQLTKTFNSELTGTTIKNLSLATVRNSEFYYPREKEQTKIATFLSAVDEKISQLSQKHQLLSQYKQGMMQKLFSQQIRFKADDGNEFEGWEEKPLNYFLYTSKLKNKNLKYSKNEVLSVSGEIGIVNQIELLGRSYAGVSVAPYGVVEHGDIVYTKSPLKSNPYGIIKANKGKSGIVSTLYAIYKCRENIIPNLVDYYFQNDMKLNHFLKPLVKKGAKNDMKVNNDHVLTGLVCFPSSIEEQTKIVNFLSTIDQKIDFVSQQIEQAKQWKKGLLQQMFV